MKLIAAVSLFFVLLFTARFAYAAVDQSGQPSGASGSGKLGQTEGFFQSNHPHAVFAGPKVGWLQVPGEQPSFPGKPNF